VEVALATNVIATALPALAAMAGRAKPHQKIVVACARELAGFVWAIATDQPLLRQL